MYLCVNTNHFSWLMENQNKMNTSGVPRDYFMK